jgi:heptosyltransferase-3
VKYTHQVDHWRMNRANPGYLAKRLQYWKTRVQALKEIRAVSYDLSLSLHPWRADFLPLAWQAKIPVRAAFNGGLWAPLATTLAEYPEVNRLIHQTECQAALLRSLGIAEEHMQKRRASLAPSSAQDTNEVFALLQPKPYSIIHMGAGVPAKEPPLTFWRDMAIQLSATQQVLFTGKGTREFTNADTVMKGLPNCINACGKLSWGGFVAAIRHAQTFYGVDSMASHVAAAVGTKCVAMYGGMNTIARWRPESANAIVWSNAVPCAPCHRQYGCSAMTCMQGFSPNDILQIQ